LNGEHEAVGFQGFDRRVAKQLICLSR
jgi:hypothetical protein